jgi:hypothetical protein
MRNNAKAAPAKGFEKAQAFQVITFFDAKLDKQIIILYALGADGVVREFNGGKWNPFPILKG